MYVAYVAYVAYNLPLEIKVILFIWKFESIITLD